jgi:hypothetical protein
LLGQDIARSWVQPCLLGYKIRWGESTFQQAKTGYESQRRAEAQNGG